jgi:hypothetical protein
MDDLASFRASLREDAPPPGLPLALQALWWDGKGNWERAHAAAQDDAGADGSLVHAYLHRVEGDPGNARYWYSRAGRAMPAMPLADEWAALVTGLLARAR